MTVPDEVLAALHFYADEEHHHQSYDGASAVERDRGALARKALATIACPTCHGEVMTESVRAACEPPCARCDDFGCPGVRWVTCPTCGFGPPCSPPEGQ